MKASYTFHRNRVQRREGQQRIPVLIADDSARARAGLRALLATLPEVDVVGEATNGKEAIRLVEETRPAIVLMDLLMPVMDGLEATRLIKQRWPEVGVIIVTMHADSRGDALAAGADVFVIKGDAPEQLLAAVLTGQEVSHP